MSYILDALRRTEAERGRGAVPGIHTPAVPMPGAAAVAGRSTVSPALVAVAVVAVAAVTAAGTWWVLQRSDSSGVAVGASASAVPAPSSLVAATAPVAPTVSVAPAAPAARVAATAPVAPVAPVGVAPAAPTPSTAPPVTAQQSATTVQRDRAALPPAAARAAVPETARARPSDMSVDKFSDKPAEPERNSAQPTRTAQANAATSATGAGGGSAMGTVFAQADLPEAVRAQLPSLKISGVTYSGNPAYRMAIVNGQVLQEGDAAGPGLLLEKIEPQRTVWSFKGYRYSLSSQ